MEISIIDVKKSKIKTFYRALVAYYGDLHSPSDVATSEDYDSYDEAMKHNEGKNIIAIIKFEGHDDHKYIKCT